MSFHHEQQHPASRADCIERDQAGKINAVLVTTAGVAALVAACVTIISLYLTAQLHWDGAFRDLWEFVDDIERQFRGEWSADYLLEAYGGAHRIFFPKLLFFADYRWFGGRNGLTIITALLCQFAWLWLIARALSKQVNLSIPERILIAAGFVLALFSTTQVSNFLYAMDVQWYMSNLFGLASLYALGREPQQQAWHVIITLGIVAALCNFTGLMALPVAILSIVATRQWRRWPVILLLATLCLLYVHHDKNEQQIVLSALRRSDNALTSLYIIIDTLAKMLPYILRYLASPLSREWPMTGSVLSMAGVAVVLYYWLQLYRKAALSRWQRLCLYIATYVVASAVFTAFGRIIYPNSAVAERYQTLVLPWLPALFGLMWPDLRRKQWLSVAWLLIFGCYLLPAQVTSAREMGILSHRVNLAHAAARAGVLEPPYILASLSHPLIKNNINSVKDNDHFLRNQQLGYFRHLPALALGNNVALPPALPACTGTASFQRDDKSSTWLADGLLLLDGKPLTDVILLQDNRVAGIGILMRPEGFLLPLAWQPAADSRFRAFARKDHLATEQPVTLLGISDSRPACVLTVAID